MGTSVIINWTYRGEDGRHVELIDAVSGTLMSGPFFSLPLDATLQHAINEGVCASCKRPVHDCLLPCLCSVHARFGGYIEVVLSGEEEDRFNNLLRKAMDTQRKNWRKTRSIPESGALTDEEVTLLLGLQEGLCFYCAEPFEQVARGLVFDRDHYLSVAQGGKTTLENTVLACPSCNNSKGEEHGYWFEIKMRRKRRPELKDRYAKMRRRFRQQLKRLKRSHIAGIPV